jgi:hypothetical protein
VVPFVHACRNPRALFPGQRDGNAFAAWQLVLSTWRIGSCATASSHAVLRVRISKASDGDSVVLGLVSAWKMDFCRLTIQPRPWHARTLVRPRCHRHCLQPHDPIRLVGPPFLYSKCKRRSFEGGETLRLSTSTCQLHHMKHLLRGHMGNPSGDGDGDGDGHSGSRPPVFGQLHTTLHGLNTSTEPSYFLGQRIAKDTDRSVSLLPSTHSVLLETQLRMSYPRLSCGSCNLSFASAKCTHYSRRVSWRLHRGAGHLTEFATDPPFPWDLYENGIMIRTWPCVWPVQEGLSGLSWVRLAWKSPDDHIGSCKSKYKTPADLTAPSCSNSPRLSELPTGLAIFINIL